MNAMIKPIKIAIVLASLITPSLIYGQSTAEKEVAAAVESLRKAMVDADKAALENLAAKELSYGHSGGKVEDKATFMEVLTSGKSDFVSIELTDQTIALVGDNAIVRHTLTAATNDGGKAGAVKLSVLLVWQKQNKHWTLIARQAVKIP
ncbi:MAG TPA: nuclear transport factor 2 family protein [Pedobacter sp.]|uniref:nuclear transport factor 2 family protein n=1 Tax=Pedobacter sp. TaxID=1411316 RepID=UPI002C02E1A5|nr:nuclear transport factor 2 family protein [Pedobacter sp.]HMI05750.1 nuclear transport factor 2 family protein [Pedobacter sp.]